MTVCIMLQIALSNPFKFRHFDVLFLSFFDKKILDFIFHYGIIVLEKVDKDLQIKSFL